LSISRANQAGISVCLARVILETLKVEIAAAHLNRLDIPSVPIVKAIDAVPVSKRQ